MRKQLSSIGSFSVKPWMFVTNTHTYYLDLGECVLLYGGRCGGQSKSRRQTFVELAAAAAVTSGSLYCWQKIESMVLLLLLLSKSGGRKASTHVAAC